MQKKLVVIRHAKSSWSNFGLSDFDRPLNNRGKRDAPFMARKLHDAGVQLDLILSSPSNRTLLTAEYFRKEFNCNIEPMRKLYHGDVEDIMESVYSVSSDVNTVGIFAHNPGITYFANEISSRSIDNVPTCGVLICDVAADKTWQDLMVNDISLKHFLFPKMYF